MYTIKENVSEVIQQALRNGFSEMGFAITSGSEVSAKNLFVEINYLEFESFINHGCVVDCLKAHFWMGTKASVYGGREKVFEPEFPI